MRHFKKSKATLLPSLEEDIQFHVLPNGIRIYTKKIPYLFSTNIGIWVPVGSSSEPEGKEGIAHFLEHLFFKGTKTRTTHDIMEAIECKGGQINAFTTQEYTCFYIKTLTENVALAVEILADILQNSTFYEIDKEREVILQEISLLEDTPEDVILDLFHQFVWHNYPLSKPILGTVHSVKGITRQDVVSFYKKIYTTQNLIITVVGNFEEKELLAQFSRWFKDFPNRVIKRNTRRTSIFQPGVKHHQRDISQIHFCLGYPAPTITDDERFICELASNILGGGSVSRLFYRIREQEGLAYNIFSFHELFRDAGTFGVYAGVAPENFRTVVDIILHEIEKLKREPISPEELELYRQELKGDFLLAHEHAETHMSRMGKSIIYYDHVLSLKEILDAFDQITPHQICQFFQKYCTPENIALVSLGPAKYRLYTKEMKDLVKKVCSGKNE